MGQSRLRGSPEGGRSGPEAGQPAAGPAAGQGPFPGLWPLCAAHPTPLPQRAVCSVGTGGADNSGCSLRRWATSRISPVTWHLAWEPAPPTCSLGKAQPRPGGGGQDPVCVGGGWGVPLPRQILGAWPALPPAALPSPWQAGMDISRFAGQDIKAQWDPTARGGCGGHFSLSPGNQGSGPRASGAWRNLGPDAGANRRAHLVQMTSSCRLPWQRWHWVHRREKRSSRALRWDT